MAEDFVDHVLAQWGQEIPDLDLEAMAVFSRLTRVFRLATRPIYANIETFGLNETEFNVLAALNRSGPPYRLAAKELSSAMLITSGGMTYVIDQLENAGHVRRMGDPRDRRSTLIELTGQGKQLIHEAVAAHNEVCRALLAPLSKRELGELSAGLRALLVALDREAAEGVLAVTAQAAGK
jgi:DNA-binding MarR family transcriptional regulator